MNHQIFRFFKSAKPVKQRLSQLTVAIAASVVLLVGTACSPSSPSVSGTGSYNSARPNQTELYRTTQPEEDGANRYSDTDPRRNTKGLGAETKARVDQAKGNLNKSQNQKQFTNEVKGAAPIRDGSRDISERAGDAIEGLKQDLSEGTQRGVKNLQRNTADAKQGVKATVNEAQDNAAELGRDTSRSAQRTADQVKSRVDSARQDLGDKASNLLDDASRTASRSGIANSGTANVNALQSKAQQTPVLDNSDLIERVKDSFSTATQNLGDFSQDAANNAR